MPLVFDLFTEDDEASPVGSKRGLKVEKKGDKEYQQDLKKNTTILKLQLTIDKRKYVKMELGASFIDTLLPFPGDEPHDAQMVVSHFLTPRVS